MFLPHDRDISLNTGNKTKSIEMDYSHQRPYGQEDHPSQSIERHQDGIPHSQFDFGTSSESPQLTWVPGIEHGISNPAGQGAYRRPDFSNGLPSPTCPAPAANFNHAISTADLVQSIQVGAIASPLSAAEDQGSEATFFINQFVSPESAWASINPSTYLDRGHGHVYPVSQTFVQYVPPKDTVAGLLEFREEAPSLEITWPLDHKPKRSLQTNRQATKPKGRSTVDGKHRVGKKKAVVRPAPIPPSPPGQSPLPPPPLPTPPLARTSLRTATRKNCPAADPSPKPGESVEGHELRTIHNLVEQKYRLRVQGGFEALIEVLPSDSDDDERNSGTRKQPRRMSKADVLAKTTKVMVSMTEENKNLKKEMEKLKAQLAVYLGRGAQ
ncbi:hypothetical protein QBC43DRAFT_312149 [Cladorrhinum sp. PSN259]|nr:hypothetical protein QBC43DRAFT_312149 [Cladorrhinum sp. PSN259]